MLNIWNEAEFQTKSTLGYIIIDQLCASPGKQMCRALPACDSFTGCNYTTSLWSSGKEQHIKKLEKNRASQVEFAQLNNSDLHELKNIFPQLEKFACTWCIMKKIEKRDEFCTDLFLHKYEHKEDENICYVKKLDGCPLPSSSSVLRQKWQQKWCIAAKTWMQSTDSSPIFINAKYFH